MSDYSVTVNNLCTYYDFNNDVETKDNTKLAVCEGKKFILIPNKLGFERILCLFQKYVLKQIKDDPVSIQNLKTEIINMMRTKGFEHYFESILNVNSEKPKK